MNTQRDKGQIFADLHRSGTFMLANFWDPGSARILEGLGFAALASTSAGFAQSIGTVDYQITLEQKLEHIRAVCAVTSVPVAVDFENGFADDPAACAANVLRLAEQGAVGASVEDWSGSQIYPASLAAERIAACAEAVATLDFPFTLTARAENLLHGQTSMEDTIGRLQAFSAAGADVLYAPGLANTEQIQTVLDAVDKPVNVLSPFLPQTKLADYEAMGVRRLSVGGALMNYVLAGLFKGAERMSEGDFSWVMESASGHKLNELLGDS
ncbi:MAG: isocitrate lyase/phosphoenolpyruvate mutase family protein [Pseudomonadota bacterium]